MADFFRSPKLRIARAKKHFGSLEEGVQRFFADDPCIRVVDPHADGVHSLHKFKLVRSIPEDLGGDAGDVLGGLRSALDHAGYASARCAGVTDPEYTSFPFASSATDLDRVINGRCKDIPPEIRAYMRALEPYEGGNDPCGLSTPPGTRTSTESRS